MPEGDTIFVTAGRLRAVLAGETLVQTDFRVPRFATVDLRGRVVEDVVSRGKHLLVRVAGGATVHTHFAMDGRFDLHRHGERWRGPAWRARAVLATAAWEAVGFDLALVEVLRRTDEPLVLGHLGPDPLGPDWDPDEVLRRLVADPERPIGEALLDQRVMAGPGNVWKSEICFLRGLDPATAVGRVRDPGRLVRLVGELFEANRTLGMQVTTGDVRRGRRQWVYGRVGQPCRRCGTIVACRGSAPERVTFWCPHCQPAASGGARALTAPAATPSGGPPEPAAPRLVRPGVRR